MITLIIALLAGRVSQIVLRIAAAPGFIGAAVLAIMGLGSPDSGLVFLLLPAAAGMYILATYAIKKT
ncbi:hypothetical protein [Actinomadura violacea]|uniref:Uncharacterized protein n=1 Tax=Actinomadura violacea TaxID=2819934 RepID=A0ABS3RR25_9ACTN|nr:hypothetical protein [Actinomadura violacea]MBO2458529.1 hypothetical protein [Actinomadura violacea]